MLPAYFFKDSDFAGCTPPCKLDDMNPELIERLDYARSLCGRPFRVNSAYRSFDYERSKGRAGNSSHCKGLAVDIACAGSDLRLLMVQSLLRAGFRRIGIADTFIHVDVDSTKPPCIWLYD